MGEALVSAENPELIPVFFLCGRLWTLPVAVHCTEWPILLWPEPMALGWNISSVILCIRLYMLTVLLAYSLHRRAGPFSGLTPLFLMWNLSSVILCRRLHMLTVLVAYSLHRRVVPLQSDSLTLAVESFQCYSLHRRLYMLTVLPAYSLHRKAGPFSFSGAWFSVTLMYQHWQDTLAPVLVMQSVSPTLCISQSVFSSSFAIVQHFSPLNVHCFYSVSCNRLFLHWLSSTSLAFPPPLPLSNTPPLSMCTVFFFSFLQLTIFAQTFQHKSGFSSSFAIVQHSSPLNAHWFFFSFLHDYFCTDFLAQLWFFLLFSVVQHTSPLNAYSLNSRYLVLLSAVFALCSAVSLFRLFLLLDYCTTLIPSQYVLF